MHRRRALSKKLGSPRAAATAVAAALLAGLPALAQDERPPQSPSDPSDSKVEEIIVKGSTEGSVDFAASDSVTAFNAADLQAIGAQTIENIAAFTPNLEIVTSGATTPTFFIRGVGLNDFNANATSSVSIYQDDVNFNAQGLQLPLLFDPDSVDVLRGPQGTGLARNASAGAIKIYTRKPSGQFGGFLIGTHGNYDFQDYQGAVEAPLFQDILSARIAFRWSDHEGYMRNGCGALPPERFNTFVRPYQFQWLATCHTAVTTFPGNTLFDSTDTTNVPPGLPKRVNDLHVWGMRGTVRFEPGLDTSWLAGVQYTKRNELSRLGHAYGAFGGQFGVPDSRGYKKPSIVEMQARKFLELAASCNCDIENTPELWQPLRSAATTLVAPELAENLDDDPYTGYYDRVGPTRNEVLTAYLRGEIYLPFGIEMKTVSGYADYDRLIDVDIDFSPTPLAEVTAPDELYQLSQDVSFEGDLGSFDPATWEAGGYFLYEDLNAEQEIMLDPNRAAFLISGRVYSQQIRSYGVYAQFARDIWSDFTLDGGVRWNSESKDLRMKVLTGFGTGDCTTPTGGTEPCSVQRERSAKFFRPDESWQAPTGTVRLSYHFTEDMRWYWKYARGWKAGHFNAASPPRASGISVAKPEKIDAFETGVAGSWFNGALTADGSLFYYTYEDYQLFTIEADFGTLPAFVVLSVDNAEVYGGELDLVAKPWQGAFLEVRGSWLESRFVDFVSQQVQRKNVGNTSVTLIREIDSTGNRLLNSPQFKISATVEQAIPLGPYGALIPRYDVVWTSETFFDATEGRGVPDIAGQSLFPEHTFAQNDFFLHNVRLSYAPPSQNPVISFWVRNLEDKPYRTLGADASAFLRTSLHFISDPRTYGVDVVFNF